MSHLIIHWNQKLGSGGEAVVFLGEYTETGMRCAVKVPLGYEQIPHVPAVREHLRLQVQQEALRHQQVRGDRHVKLLGVNLDWHVPFLTLELAANGSLLDEIRAQRARGGFEPTLALARVEEILEAIRQVHASGLVHRDVKPANLLRCADTKLKLADFGMGRTLNRPCEFQTKAFAGTAAYAAPEQLRTNCFDGRADIYAAGAILYEMLTGSPPAPYLRPLPQLANVGSNLLPAVDRLLDRLLATDPDARPRTADIAIREVRAVLAAYDRVARTCVDCGHYGQASKCPECGRVHCRPS